MAESKATVLVAGTANLVIAILKILAGLLSGSSAMLAEGAHSIADTLNEGFLLTAIQRSDKPADSQHQFGYGKERYFWSLLAAVGIFVLGAGFSVIEGIRTLLEPEPLGTVWVAYAVLGLSFVFEGISWLKAMRQLHGEARKREISIPQHVRQTDDPTVTTVAFEDSAALVGLVLAAIGISLHLVTGWGGWDGIASIAIGVLLVGLAGILGNQSKALLIGEAVPRQMSDAVRRIIADSVGVDQVVEVLTMRLGPGDVLVAARVDMEDTSGGDAIERIADEVEASIQREYSQVRHVFLDPTTAKSGVD
ncbi:MAG TPA: cation diffusion facilitator family transporter [Nocardioidaceae bacterium]|nr:cation diffusion facilitator family transporter [Nocardioidaceae bacterium]